MGDEEWAAAAAAALKEIWIYEEEKGKAAALKVIWFMRGGKRGGVEDDFGL